VYPKPLGMDDKKKIPTHTYDQTTTKTDLTS
jgi:hypothetical protein